MQGLRGFASDTAVEATDNLVLVQSLSGAAAQVCSGAAIVAKHDTSDAVQSQSGFAVASSVALVPVGFAGGGRFNTYAALRDEGGSEWRRSGSLLCRARLRR